MRYDIKPGPELDKVVAQLFGWDYFDTKLGIVVKKPNGETCHAHFSTEWTGMRLVVEEMQQRGYELLLTHYEAISGWGWAASFGRCIRSSDTATHAVVLAAIEALQGEDTP